MDGVIPRSRATLANHDEASVVAYGNVVEVENWVGESVAPMVPGNAAMLCADRSVASNERVITSAISARERFSASR
jgi:hypothetical protein